jgi:late competence protein required for DNA uptake (superfamily II DNA/RNA helicase)
MNYKNVRKNRLTHKLRNYFRKQRRQHDPLLALNMSIFNFEGGWSDILNPPKVRENH